MFTSAFSSATSSCNSCKVRSFFLAFSLFFRYTNEFLLSSLSITCLDKLIETSSGYTDFLFKFLDASTQVNKKFAWCQKLSSKYIPNLRKDLSEHLPSHYIIIQRNLFDTVHSSVTLAAKYHQQKSNQLWIFFRIIYEVLDFRIHLNLENDFLRNTQNVFLLSYDDLVSDLPSSLQGLSLFLGQDVNFLSSSESNFLPNSSFDNKSSAKKLPLVFKVLIKSIFIISGFFPTFLLRIPYNIYHLYKPLLFSTKKFPDHIFDVYRSQL